VQLGDHVALRLQAPQRLTDGRGAHAEPGRQLALAEQMPWLELTPLDEAADGIGDEVALAPVAQLAPTGHPIAPVVDKTDYDLHFRLVYLLDQTDVDPSTLHVDRIAVVIPGPWEDTARDISRRYLALVKMQEEYQDKQGPEAEEVKRFVSDELRKARGDIALTQKQLYRAGRIVTRAELGIDPNQVFADPDKADELMAGEFHFVVMNGAVETREQVVCCPYTGAGPLRVRSLRVEPQSFALRGDVAVVISLMHLDATARGQPVPPRMRVLSIYTRDGPIPGWTLTARSITPILGGG
jgi:hypothetical protein